MLTSELATFATRFNLTPKQAVVLPALFEKCAESSGQNIRALVSQATFTNNELGKYLASVAVEVSNRAQ